MVTYSSINNAPTSASIARTGIEAIMLRSFEDIWNDGNLDLVDELYAVDFFNHDPAAMGFNGSVGFRQIDAVGEFPRCAI